MYNLINAYKYCGVGIGDVVDTTLVDLFAVGQVFLVELLENVPFRIAK